MKLGRVWIEQFRVRGYRSCISTSLRASSDLSVLIGPNGSGKTNVLHAILLLRRFPRRRLRRLTSEARPSRAFVQAVFRVGNVSIPYRAWMKYTTSDKNEDEVLAVREQWNFRGVTKRDGWYAVPADTVQQPYYYVRAVGRSPVLPSN